MLAILGIKAGLDYYACEDHFESEATSLGKQRWWAENAKLNVTIEDITVKKAVLDTISFDHKYAKENSHEQEDFEDAVDLKMGTDFFLESQSISCLEETVRNDPEEPVDMVDSQVKYSYYVAKP